MQSYENHTATFPLQHFIWLPLSALSLIALIVYFFTSNTLLQTILMTTTLIIAIIGVMLARLYGLKLQDRIIWLIALLHYFGQHTKSTDLVNFFEASQKIWQDNLGIDVPQKIQDIYSSYLLTI